MHHGAGRSPAGAAGPRASGAPRLGALQDLHRAKVGPSKISGAPRAPFNQTTIDHILLDQRSAMIALGRTAGAISRRGWTRRTWDLRRPCGAGSCRGA